MRLQTLFRQKKDDSPENPPVNIEKNAGGETVDVLEENVEVRRNNGRPKGCTSEQIRLRKTNVQNSKEEFFKMLVTLKDNSGKSGKHIIPKGIVEDKVE